MVDVLVLCDVCDGGWGVVLILSMMATDNKTKLGKRKHLIPM